MGNRTMRIIRDDAGAMPSGAAEWSALRRRDRRYDGKFVYAAITTGIYCRPSCPARIPHRRNTLIFLAAPDAERQGYIPCRRCHPRSPLTAAERRIIAALEYIETHLDQPVTLDTLSQVSGASAHHFRELFQRIVGLSPKAFCDARRIAGFKRLLRAGEPISGACYEVGFGSSRALYEKANRGLGMTPSTYRRGGAGRHLHYTITRSALGPALLAGAGRRLCAVLVGEKESVLISALRNEFPQADVGRQQFPAWEDAMRSLAEEDPLISKLPMNLRRRIFRARVWQTLA